LNFFATFAAFPLRSLRSKALFLRENQKTLTAKVAKKGRKEREEFNLSHNRLAPPCAFTSCVIVSSKAVKIEAVISVSALRKLGTAARVVQQQAGRNRLFSAVMGGVLTTARSFGRAMHQLWLEVTGTVFLSMAVFGAAAGVREYMKYTAGQASPSRVAIAACFTAAFAWFGLSSFWRVRRKSERP
jgi:hypothetical protein